MTGAPELLLAHHLKTLKLPTFLREYDKLARQCAAEGLDHVRFLARLVELELIDRERRMIERRIKAAKFPATKSLDSFDFKAIPTLTKMQVLELARCEWIERRENVIALGPSGTGKTHVALGLGLAACQKGLSVGFTTAAALVHELMEARDERRLLRLQKQLVNHKLLIIDELGFVPLSKTGAELLFELISQRYERGATLITSNLPFEEWTETFGSERLTGALLDRLTHHVSILEMNGDSYRLSQIIRPSDSSALCFLIIARCLAVSIWMRNSAALMTAGSRVTSLLILRKSWAQWIAPFRRLVRRKPKTILPCAALRSANPFARDPISFSVNDNMSA